MLGHVHNMQDPQDVLDVHNLAAQLQGLNIAAFVDLGHEHEDDQQHQLGIVGHHENLGNPFE
jgi:hypothetical protein